MATQGINSSSLFNTPTASTTSNTSNSSSSDGMVNGMPTEGTFLQLLVAQLQYQDPTNPTDSTQFVSQLAQFSQLEQVMGIKTDTDTLVTDAGGAASTTTTGSSSGT
jgi:flagellar basal-body rod modification protein FlgD